MRDCFAPAVSESTQKKAKARDDLTLVTAGEMFEAR